MDERSIRDIIREEWKKLSGLTWRQRLGYIWDYYKPLMVAVLVVIMLISIGITMYQNMQINHLLNVYFINCNSSEVDAEGIADSFAGYLGGIGPKDEITVDTSTTMDIEGVTEYSMASQMKFTAVAAAGEVDVVFLDQGQLERYRDSGGLRDLREVLSAEQLERWADELVYGKDEETGEEIVAAINVQEAPLIQKYNAYFGKEAYAAVFASSPHPEMSADFLEYIHADN